MTLEELDRLHAAATAEEWAVSHDRTDQPNLHSRDADGFEHWVAILPHQCLVSLEVQANANASAIVALHNAWPEVSAQLRAAEAEVERLRSEVAEQRTLLRWFLDGDDHTHEDDCGARGNHDLDVCRNEASQCHNMCEGPHCTCDATEMRDRARAALGEP